MELRSRGRSKAGQFDSSIASPNKLSETVRNCKKDYESRLSNEEFLSCVTNAVNFTSDTSISNSRCSCFFKVIWLCFITLLAFGLLASGFKPIAFLIHKVNW